MTQLWIVGLAAVCLSSVTVRAEGTSGNDLRTIRVGMQAAALPDSGYADLNCADGETPLPSWQRWRDCRPNAAGLRKVSFRYNDTPDHETLVAGQPVLLSLAIADEGVVQSLTMQSDPSGRAFLRKRGIHLGERVMNHYGESGWTCTDGEQAAGEEPVGTLFVRSHCEKTLGLRFLVVDRALFRRAGQSQDTFVSQTVFTLSLVKPHAP